MVPEAHFKFKSKVGEPLHSGSFFGNLSSLIQLNNAVKIPEVDAG